jgi:hypothetical protein
MVLGTGEAVMPDGLGVTSKGGGLMLGTGVRAYCDAEVDVTWMLEKLITFVVTGGM